MLLYNILRSVPTNRLSPLLFGGRHRRVISNCSPDGLHPCVSCFIPLIAFRYSASSTAPQIAGFCFVKTSRNPHLLMSYNFSCNPDMLSPAVCIRRKKPTADTIRLSPIFSYADYTMLRPSCLYTIGKKSE